MEKGKRMYKKNSTDGVNKKEEGKNLNEILGSFYENPFHPKYKQLEDLEAALKEMDMADMQKLGTRVGVIPVSDKRSMREKIIKQYKIEAKKSMPTILRENPKNVIKDRKKLKQIQSILNKGL